MPCLVIALAAVAAVLGCSADAGGGASDASRTGGGGSAGFLASTGGEPGTGGRNGSTIVGTPEELADVYAHAAVVLGSCLPDDGINRNSAHLWYAASNARLWSRYARTAGCIASHGGGCDAVRACVGWEYAVTSDPCTPGCSGTTFTLCGNGHRLRVDCSKLDLSCDPLGICTESPATGCDEEMFVNMCGADGQPAICDDDIIIHGPDCAGLGLGCMDGSCIGTGPGCTGGRRSYQGDVFYDGISCDGGMLVSCVYGREHRLDCASVAPGFTCQTHAGTSFCGIAAECTPAAPAEGSGPDESCEGDAVVFCNAGRLERIECTSLGFERCEATNGAICAPTFTDGLP